MNGDELRRLLERTLAQPRFSAPPESPWDRLVSRILAEFMRLLAAAVDAVGGPVIAGLIALAIVGIVATTIGIRLAGRRAAVIEERLHLAKLLESGADPDEYLDGAERASRAGDHASAVRLRFIGGVLRLGLSGRIRYEPGLTTGAIERQVDDPAFTALAAQFDLVVYGGRSADADDDLRSRELWSELGAPA